LGHAKISVESGIRVDLGSVRFMLDPHSPVRADYSFVSHAHIDHVHRPSKNERVLSSEETRDLSLARGYDLGETLAQVDGVELYDTGHILGSRAIRIGDEVLYTGDIAGRERAFLRKGRMKQARVLIMETTYGDPSYVFPPAAKLVRDVHTLISESFHRGKPVVLMGYPLGKAQLLSYFFSTWSPLYVHESVAAMNEVHRRHGVELKKGKVVSLDTLEHGGLSKGPWLMIAPMMHNRNRFMARLKKDYGAVSVAFSGWASHEGYRYSMGSDYAYPLSDHCDYPELMKLVQDVSPELVLTTHGFAAEFARDLRKVGFGARTLASYQSSLLDYVRGD
jgi:putative mRNA 3-end processing factor